MAIPISTTGLYRALVDAGFHLPANCGDVTLEMPVDGVLMLVCRIHLTPEDLGKIGIAFQRIAVEHKIV